MNDVAARLHHAADMAERTAVAQQHAQLGEPLADPTVIAALDLAADALRYAAAPLDPSPVVPRRFTVEAVVMGGVQLVASDIEALQQQITATVRLRRNGRGGRHAGEHVIAAARAMYNQAIADGLIEAGASPAHRVVKPRRLPSTRRALTPAELEQINQAARSGGNDTILDALLLRVHTETACRRGGALGLRLMDLDAERGLVRLREKGGTLRWQPVTLQLAARLADHAACRGATDPTDALLRFRDGRALTSRRYDHLWARIGRELPWVAAQGISAHWLRHTTLTWVERHFGYGVARAYARHTDSTGPATTTYIKADLQAVATALAAMTGQPHPMAAPA